MIVTIFGLKLQELFLPFVTSPLNRGRFQSPFAGEDFGVRLRPEGLRADPERRQRVNLPLITNFVKLQGWINEMGSIPPKAGLGPSNPRILYLHLIPIKKGRQNDYTQSGTS